MIGGDTSPYKAPNMGHSVRADMLDTPGPKFTQAERIKTGSMKEGMLYGNI
jgi:hypothetical protein